MGGQPCSRCANEAYEAQPARNLSAQIDYGLVRMFCCETCGNKRCPHATDHRLTCTGSNEPGQPGSSYA